MQRYAADDLEELRKVRPYLRSAAAFVLYLVEGADVPTCYQEADLFLDQLDKDVAAAGAAPAIK